MTDCSRCRLLPLIHLFACSHSFGIQVRILLDFLGANLEFSVFGESFVCVYIATERKFSGCKLYALCFSQLITTGRELSVQSIFPSLCGTLELAEYYTLYNEIWKKDVHMEHDLLIFWNT